jgi:hypothetical protein
MEHEMTSRNIEDVIKQIAAATDTPEEMVLRMYQATWTEFSEGARITDYLTVLVARRVRDDLSRRQQESH